MLIFKNMIDIMENIFVYFKKLYNVFFGNFYV